MCSSKFLPPSSSPWCHLCHCSAWHMRGSGECAVFSQLDVKLDVKFWNIHHHQDHRMFLVTLSHKLCCDERHLVGTIDKLNPPLPLISGNSTSSDWWDLSFKWCCCDFAPNDTALWDLMWNLCRYNSFGTLLSKSLRRLRETGGVDCSVHAYSPCYALHAS